MLLKIIGNFSFLIFQSTNYIHFSTIKDVNKENQNILLFKKMMKDTQKKKKRVTVKSLHLSLHLEFKKSMSFE